MPRKLTRELTFFAPRSCYKKKLGGKTYYMGKASETDSEANYRRAWGEWEAKLTQINREAEAQQLADDAAALNHLNSLQASYVGPVERLPEGGRYDLINKAMKGRVTAADLADKPTEADTVQILFDRWITLKTAQAKTGQKSVGRIANLASGLKPFIKLIGPDSLPKAITGGKLTDYYSAQINAIDNDEIGCETGRDRLQIAKQFLKFCWEQGEVELPRNIDSREMTITCTPGEIKPMPITAYKARLKLATGRMKAELLLMLNCGMTQSDCADLLHSEIDWKAATITRQRSKTKGNKNVPLVTYHLWPSTISAVREVMNTESEHVLSTRGGGKSVSSYINADNQPVRLDATTQAYSKLQDKLEDRWPLKSIRKLGASTLGANEKLARYSQYYLGHAPETVADTFYIKPSDDNFAEAIKWLGLELGVASPL